MQMDSSFSKLKPAERQSLLAAGSSRTYRPGEIILRQGGGREETIYVIARGAVRIERELRVRASYRLDAYGRPVRETPSGSVMERTRLVLQRLAKGSIFGEMSFLIQATGTTDVVAEEEAEIIHIPRGAVKQMIDTTPGFAGRFYHSLAVTLTRRIRQTNKLVV